MKLQQETIHRCIEDLEWEYEPNNTIWDEDNNKMHHIKTIIFKDLTEMERTVLLLYSNNGSQRKVAKLLGVSPFTINGEIQKIRNKIKEKLKEKGL